MSREHGTAPGSKGYEVRDARPGALFVAGAVLLALLTLAMFGTEVLFRALVERERARLVRHPMASERQVPPAPRLQTTPADELTALRERERELLETYGWVDREQGLARIPLERAFELLLAEGLPAAPAADAALDGRKGGR